MDRDRDTQTAGPIGHRHESIGIDAKWTAEPEVQGADSGPWMVSYRTVGGHHVMLGYGLTKKLAQLIAAAPDMLSALKAVRPFVVGEGERPKAAYEALLATIAKAEAA